MNFEDKIDDILDDEKLLNILEKYSVYGRDIYDIITEPLYDREEEKKNYIKKFNKWILPDLNNGGNSYFGKSEFEIKTRQFLNNFAYHKGIYNKVKDRYKNDEEVGMHIFSHHYNDSGMKLCLDIGEDTYEFAKKFEMKCIERNINFSYSVIDPYDLSELYRTDKLTVYCDELNQELYLKILEEVRSENRNFDYREPPILTENIDDWIGVAKNGTIASYESQIAKCMDIAISDVYDGMYRQKIFEYAKIYKTSLDDLRKNIKGLYPNIEEVIREEQENEIEDDFEDIEQAENEIENDFEDIEQEEFELDEDFEEDIETEDDKPYLFEEVFEELDKEEQDEVEKKKEYEEPEININLTENKKVILISNDIHKENQKLHNKVEKKKEYKKPEIGIIILEKNQGKQNIVSGIITNKSEEVITEKEPEEEIEEVIIEKEIENTVENVEENSSYKTNLEILKEKIRDIAINGYSKNNTEEYRNLLNELYDQRAEKFEIEESRKDRSINLRRLDSIASNVIMAYKNIFTESNTTGKITDKNLNDFQYSLDRLDEFFTSDKDIDKNDFSKETVSKPKRVFERDDFGMTGTHYHIDEDR